MSARLIVWVPESRAVPFNIHVCGDPASAVPLVLVMVIMPVPASSASSVVNEMSEEVVALLMKADVAGENDESVGASRSTGKEIWLKLDEF